MLAEPEDVDTFRLRRLATLATNANAIVAINGFWWDEGSLGYDCKQSGVDCLANPETSVFLDGQRRTHKSAKHDSETLMAFGLGGPTGLPIARVPGEPARDLDFPAYDRVRHWVYGARKVFEGGRFAAKDDDEESTQSVLGYSPTHIVMLVSTLSDIELAFRGGYVLHELESTLVRFGVTDAVQNDKGPSMAMWAQNGIDLNVDLPGRDVRSIAYGIGLVPIAPKKACEELALGSTSGQLCLTPTSRGYEAEFTSREDSAPKCGTFDFNLVSATGERVGSQGAFELCTGALQTRTYFFETGTMGGCATLGLYLRAGADFGASEWSARACPPVPGPDAPGHRPPEPEEPNAPGLSWPPATLEQPPRIGCTYVQYCNYPNHSAGTVCRTYPGCGITDGTSTECQQDVRTVCGRASSPLWFCDQPSSDCQLLP